LYPDLRRGFESFAPGWRPTGRPGGVEADSDHVADTAGLDDDRVGDAERGGDPDDRLECVALRAAAW
jgi:hypothetical protein